MTIITSKDNHKIKKARKLLIKKYRQDSYLIEGWHLFEEALVSRQPIRQVFVLEEYVDRLPAELEVVVVTQEVLKSLSEVPSPQGIIAEVLFPTLPKLEINQGRWLLLEDVQDPGNVGTMIRTADAAGLTGVILTSKAADIYNQKTLRSMQGSHFHLPVYRLAIKDLFDQVHVPVLATTLSERSVDYRGFSSQDFLLVMGNEGQGISSLVEECADHLLHIPMLGQAESLNVAVACGIVLFRLL